MDPKHFDTLARALGRVQRRQVLTLLPAGLTALVGADTARSASKKKKRKRKRTKQQRQRYKKWKRRNTQMCVTTANRVIRCWDYEVCCDPERSSEPGCASTAYPVCCQNYHFTPNARCCSAPTLGYKGACSDNFPVCCTDRCCASGSSCGDPNADCLVYTEEAQGSAYRDLEAEPR